MQGKVVEKRTGLSNDEKYTLETGSWGKGVYLIELRSKRELIGYKKLVKQ